MTKKVKRTISLIIAAIMLLSTMSVLAFADDAPPVPGEPICAEPGPHAHVRGPEVEDKAAYAQPTCAKAGKAVYIIKCTICGEVVNTREVYLPKLTSHVPAEVPVIENVKQATCKGGSYDEVYYCRICNKELERKTVKVNPDVNKHVPAPAVVDQDVDYVPATCAKAGHHYSVVYCKLCKKELSRTYIIDAPLPYHVAPTTFVKGKTRTCCDGEMKCLVCGKKLADAIPHVWDKGAYASAADKPTVTKPGKMTYTCLICLATKVVPVPPVGPKGPDVDCDGSVTTADARLILRFAVGLGNFDRVIVGDELIRLADVDDSGDVDPADARLALRLAVGLRIENV